MLTGCPGAPGGTGVDASSGGRDANTPITDANAPDANIPAVDANIPAVDADRDTGPRPDSGMVTPTCEPMDAQLDVCAAVCGSVSSAFWDGATCVPAHCNCVGTECDVYATVSLCEAAHASCDATLCASTGGAWFNRPEWCGNFACGAAPLDSCEVPTRACDCGTYRVFNDGTGCMDGPLCELRAPTDPDVLCAATGGTWMLGICGNAMCGRLSGLDCLSPGCVCGDLEIFDGERGCIRSPTCEARLLGEQCNATGLCGNGNVCCATGGASTDSACALPMCTGTFGVCGPPRP